jgi:hypothetical protein
MVRYLDFGPSPHLMDPDRPLENGVRVHPKDMGDFVEVRGLFWPCFCSWMGEPKSCKIGFDGKKYRATCASKDPAIQGCNFNRKFICHLLSFARAEGLLVDLDRIYALTKEEAEYPHLAPGRNDPAAMSHHLAMFEIMRSKKRALEAVCYQPTMPLVAKGWIGERATSTVKQRRLRSGSLLLDATRICRSVWAQVRHWLASVEIGIDGV